MRLFDVYCRVGRWWPRRAPRLARAFPRSGRVDCVDRNYRGFASPRLVRTAAGRTGAKLHFQTAETLAPRYPQWDAFQKVRARLDPQGIFTNAYLDRVLGPVGG